MMLLKCKNIFMASFSHLIKDTDSTYGHAAKKIKVETLLNNAFNRNSWGPGHSPVVII